MLSIFLIRTLQLKLNFIFFTVYILWQGVKDTALKNMNCLIKKNLRTQMGWKSFKTFSKTEPFHLVVELPDVFPVMGCSYIT